jgi:fructan beta-fructosidase
MLHRVTLAFALVLGLASAAAGQTDDILIADFEGADYGAWKATGTAFGPGPARGTLPGQMPVSGFLGKGLVNSFFQGDRTTGTLTSPPFKIERDHINLLIGGGGHQDRTCVNLLVDGKVVRTATGPNTAAGGSEQLDWHSWNVRPLRGKQAVIEIVDNETGGWGHINVDHIVQSDKPKGTQPARRDIEIAAKYLHLPVKNGAPKRRMKLVVDGATVREFEIELAEGPTDFWVFSDVSPFKGKKLTIETTLSADSKALAAIRASNDLPAAAELYQEKHRPQFHFTSRRGWLNDPNGLVYAGGEYHLFYQHNPYGWSWGNMHWGHAVSKDLVHWRELPIAIYPKRFGDWAFSGSAVVDKHNTAGFKKGNEDVIVAAYTSTGRGECIIYSNDNGATWQEYAGNPVVKHRGRDPRLLWHEPTKRWVMAVYNEDAGKTFAFHSSPNLKDWTFHSRIGEFFECPDLFELPVDGGKGKQTKWVLYAADGKYLLGDFDGRHFKPEGRLEQVWHGNMYAAQTFSDVPDGRRIQIGWARAEFTGMPFNQQMTVPCQLTLRSSDEGVRMFVQPVKELESLRGRGEAISHGVIKPGANALKGVQGELMELKLRLVPRDDTKRITLRVRGTDIVYDAAKRELSCRGVKAPVHGAPRLHVFVDRGSVEVFVSDGAAVLSVGALADPKDRAVSLTADRDAEFADFEFHELRSIWKQ